MKTEINKEELSQLNYLLEGHNGFIAGGCFKDIFQNKKPRDIDMFFENVQDFNTADKEFKNKGFEEVCNTNNAKTLINNETTVQLICKFYGTPEQILNKFDFAVCKYSYQKENENYISTFCDTYYEDLEKRKLTVDLNLDFPFSTLKRAFKYCKYGFYPTLKTVEEIAIKINESDKKILMEEFYEEG